MGVSGGLPVVIPSIPTTFQICVPTLPLIALGATYTAAVNWDSAFPHNAWEWSMDQRQLLGKAVASISNPTAAGFTLSVTASLLLSVGAQVHILGWA